MSYIIQRRVKKAIYVYEGKSYRNKQGKPRNKQRYLGKLDDDGILITRKRKLPAQIKEYKRVTKHIIIDTPPSDTFPTARTPHTLASENVKHIMGCIIERKVKKAIYVYEGRSYRNKQGKPRNKQHYLGKLDDDGVLITRKRRLPAQIKEYKRVTKHIIIDSQPADTFQTERTPHTSASENDTPPVREQSCLHAHRDSAIQERQTPSQHRFLQESTFQERLRLVSRLCSREYPQETPSSSGRTAERTLQSLPRLRAVRASTRISLHAYVPQVSGASNLRSHNELSEVS